ncbi:vesicle-associated membrane protein [Piptocephalis cylindrospora]|uniref:Synaptobrevin homolog YKT6 n=1 Tax=Piptocephalis cylindrospora TaxID=1907219 RepID=A0A4P9Y070_9FUNG|nr:vesicle-associated membrane protein [Piptocephalis cylindrospora]|eukprot:RKP12125.1 vesicle-associated membrane protein [Piptocephalis cylindrospora]
MSLIYALVARGPLILAEHSTSTGNFASVTQSILEKIPSRDSRLTYVYDRYLFHYISERGIVYLCMADESFGRRIPFAFLEDVKHRFTETYTTHEADAALAYGLNEFARVLADRMIYFSNDPESDNFRRVQGEIDQVKEVMVQNIERVLERGERIDLLVDKTDNLNQAAFAFRKRSTALKRAMWWKNAKLMIMLAFVALMGIYCIICAACGFPSWDHCRA